MSEMTEKQTAIIPLPIMSPKVASFLSKSKLDKIRNVSKNRESVIKFPPLRRVDEQLSVQPYVNPLKNHFPGKHW